MLALLTLLAFVAAIGVAVRAKPSGRAELALATGLFWNLFVTLPVYVLGLANVLTRSSLAAGALLTFSVALAASFIGVRWRDHLREVLRAVWHVTTLPFAGIALARRERSLAFPVLGFTFCLLVYSFVLAWFCPSWRGWDALWYHEPIVGFTIQNHGFRMVDVPQGLQKVNGYPRLGEMTQLWFVIFTDRRLIDVSNSVVSPILILAQYLLCFRYCKDKPTSMALAVALFLMPANVSLLQSTYVDLHVAAVELAGVYYATRPTMRTADGWLAAIALTLAAGAKQMALVPVAILALFTLVRLLRQNWREHRRAAVLAIVLGSALLCSMLASIYLRNWLHFKNPFWPELKYDNDALGIHWPGNYEIGTAKQELGYNRLDMNLPFDQFLQDLLSIPYSWTRQHYGEVHDYGFMVSWFVLPIGCIVFIVLWLAAWRALVGRLFRKANWALAEDSKNLLLVSLTVLAMLATTPALWASRYNIAAVGMMMALLAWAGGRRGFERFREGLGAACAIGMLITFFWVTPRWCLLPSELVLLAKTPYPKREVTPTSVFSPGMHIPAGSPVNTDIGEKREKTLGRGAVVAFNESYGNFPALFWNNEFSNRIVYLPAGSDFIARAKDAGALWIYCAHGDPMTRDLSAKDSGFTNLGPLNVEGWGVVFRRDRW